MFYQWSDWGILASSFVPDTLKENRRYLLIILSRPLTGCEGEKWYVEAVLMRFLCALILYAGAEGVLEAKENVLQDCADTLFSLRWRLRS